MKKLLLIFLLMNCGPQQRDHSLDAQFISYHPAYESLIKQKIESIYHVNVEQVNFFYSDSVLLNEQCLPASHGVEVMGCIYADEKVSYIQDIVKDRCRVVLHELIHQAHYELYGDSDSDHKDPQFRNTAEICKSLGIPIDNWS